MAKSKDRDASPSSEQPHRALLLELKGERAAEGGSAATALTEMFAALSLGSLQKTLPTSILSITKDLCEETTRLGVRGMPFLEVTPTWRSGFDDACPKVKSGITFLALFTERGPGITKMLACCF